MAMARVVEHRAARADGRGVHEELELVDQPCRRERRRKADTADAEDVLARLALERVHFVGHGTACDVGALPARGLQLVREHDLARLDDPLGKGVVGVRRKARRRAAPVVEVALLDDLAAQQDRVDAREHGIEVAPERRIPAPPVAPAPQLPVDVAVGRRHEPVDRHLHLHDELSHRSLLQVACANRSRNASSFSILKPMRKCKQFLEPTESRWPSSRSPCARSTSRSKSSATAGAC
ncbi:hypothetical protein D9M72_494060 [compost metagenome]